jgi:hypothetical protein
MLDMAEFFDLHEARHPYRTRLRHPTDIVAPEVDEHQMLGLHLTALSLSQLLLPRVHPMIFPR